MLVLQCFVDAIYLFKQAYHVLPDLARFAGGSLFRLWCNLLDIPFIPQKYFLCAEYIFTKPRSSTIQHLAPLLRYLTWKLRVSGRSSGKVSTSIALGVIGFQASSPTHTLSPDCTLLPTYSCIAYYSLNYVPVYLHPQTFAWASWSNHSAHNLVASNWQPLLRWYAGIWILVAAPRHSMGTVPDKPSEARQIHCSSYWELG